MIAYNRDKLFNLRLLQKAKQWYARQLLSAEQFVMITDKYKADFYTPNLFVKVGLFLFTWISILAAVGLFALVFFDSFRGDTAIVFMCFLFGAGCIFLLETLIRRRRLYRSGIDEALLYAALAFAGCAIGSLLFGFNSATSAVLSFTLLFMPVLAAATLRYADTLSAFLLIISGYVVLFLLLLKLGDIAKMIMPFAMMIGSVVLYLSAKRLEKSSGLQYWQTALVVVDFISLLFFYAAGNYYVIREASIQYFHLHLNRSEDIPLAFFFYLFTALVPLLYVLFGLKRKDRTLLWTGLATIALSAATFHYYFPSKRPDIVFVFAGICMIGVAYAAIKNLKAPRRGITFEEEPDENSFLRTNAEALLQARNFGHATPAPQTHTGFEFGGGSSGGGGATNEW